MTPKEIELLAERVAKDWNQKMSGPVTGVMPLAYYISQAIREAVQAERERCAGICDALRAEYLAFCDGNVDSDHVLDAQADAVWSAAIDIRGKE